MTENLFEKDSSYYYHPRLEMLKYIPENALRILEVGCGEGAFCREMKSQNPKREIWGLEINEKAAQKAQILCDRILVGDFDKLCSRLPEKYFDCIVFNDVLEHLYAPWETIKRCKSILSKNGVIVSSIPNFRYIHNLIEILKQGEFEYKSDGLLDITHIRFFTSKSICNMFTKQGFEILIHEGIHPKIFWKTTFVTILTFGKLKDAKYCQFATVAKLIM